MNDLTFDDYFLILNIIFVISAILLWIVSFILVLKNDQIRIIKIYRIIAFILIPPYGVFYTIYRFFLWNITKDIKSGGMKKRLQRGMNSLKMSSMSISNIIKWLFKK